MKRCTFISKALSLLLATLILFTSCVSTTVIVSNPPEAKVYLNGEPVGVTPYKHMDSKIAGTLTYLKLEKEGFEIVDTHFSRNEETDVGAIVGGIFLLFPFLWITKYKPTHSYDLVPLSGVQQDAKPLMKEQIQAVPKSKADRLRELKQLFDEKVLTQAEYEKEKKKVLDEGE